MKSPAIFRYWTVEEDNLAFRMRAKGSTDVQIARVLHRTPEAVRSRLKLRYRRTRPGYSRNGRVKLKFSRIPDDKPRAMPIVFIRHAEVEGWYLLGWRMIAINGNKITAQWQSEREPRWPDGYLAEAA